MEPSENAVQLVKGFEGLRLTAYPDPGTGGVPWTIGYGHTGGVYQGMTISEVQANAWLLDDLRAAGRAVADLVTWPINQNQFDALTSFVFNVGRTAFAGSTMRRLLNAGDIYGAAGQFQHWRYASGIVLPGLERRRAAEYALFTKE